MSSTILDYLNEDCWRAVLRHVPVRDIMRTESASRRWREVVLTYLQGLHIDIEEIQDGPVFKLETKNYKLKLHKDYYVSFEKWTRKLGPSVSTAFCYNLESLKILVENCPKLETLMFNRFNPHLSEVLPYNLNENFKCLQHLSIYSSYVNDNCVSQFIADKELTRLDFQGCIGLIGECLKTINLTKLKCLTLSECTSLEPSQPAIDRLKNLPTLILDMLPKNLFKEVYKVLGKMANLEQLEIGCKFPSYYDPIEPLCQLTKLKSLGFYFEVEDSDVEALMRCCKELRSLTLYECADLSDVSVETICRHAGGRLTTLTLRHFEDFDNGNLLNIVRRCTELTSLTVSGTNEFSLRVLPLAAAARRKARPGLRLRLDLHMTNLPWEYFKYYVDELEEDPSDIKPEVEYGNVTVVLDSPDMEFFRELEAKYRKSGRIDV